MSVEQRSLNQLTAALVGTPQRGAHSAFGWAPRSPRFADDTCTGWLA